ARGRPGHRPPVDEARRLRPDGERGVARGTRAVRRACRRAARGRGSDVSELVDALRGIPAPDDRWDDAAATGLGLLDGLVYRSNLLGADRALANQGGGNTSSKGTMVDHVGREQRVLWVKGSGTDLASITEAGFPAQIGRASCREGV